MENIPSRTSEQHQEMDREERLPENRIDETGDIRRWILDQISVEDVDGEIERHLEENGIYDKDEKGAFIIPNPSVIVDLRKNKEKASRVRHLLNQLGDVVEPEVAEEASGILWSLNKDKARLVENYRNLAREQDFMESEPTLSARTRAVEALQKYGIQSEEMCALEKELLKLSLAQNKGS